MLQKYTFSFALTVSLSLCALSSWAQSPPPAAPPPAAPPTAAPAESADQLLARSDRQNSAFSDAFFHFKMIIKEPSGPRVIEFETKQKGSQKRIVRFLSPADIKGMGILSESADVMYALLPAFGNRVRRVATHQMSQSFMGSDLSSSDMAVIELAPMYAPKYAGVDGSSTLLELNLRPGKQSEFARLKLWIDAKNATISKVEYYDASGKKLRTAERFELTQDGPQHWSPGRMVYTDHRRGNHQTELVLVKSKLNNGYGDDDFSQRALTRDN